MTDDLNDVDTITDFGALAEDEFQAFLDSRNTGSPSLEASPEQPPEPAEAAWRNDPWVRQSPADVDAAIAAARAARADEDITITDEERSEELSRRVFEADDAVFAALTRVAHDRASGTDLRLIREAGLSSMVGNTDR